MLMVVAVDRVRGRRRQNRHAINLDGLLADQIAIARQVHGCVAGQFAANIVGILVDHFNWGPIFRAYALTLLHCLDLDRCDRRRIELEGRPLSLQLHFAQGVTALVGSTLAVDLDKAMALRAAKACR